MPERRTTSNIEIDDTTPPLTEATERKFRKLIVDYCDVLVSPDVKKYEAFGQGMVWGAIALLDAQGYGEWARSVAEEEMETYRKQLKDGNGLHGLLQSSVFTAKMRRIIIPGNRWNAAV